MSNRIRVARKERNWTQSRLISELERVAARHGERLPSLETMKSRVSRWENNHSDPDEYYRILLREALGLDNRELGLEDAAYHVNAPAAEALRSRLAASAIPDATLLDALIAQTEAVRRQDRQYGAHALLEQMRAHVANVEQHVSHAVFDSSKQPLATVLADAGALAGWQAFDIGSVDQAWRFFETASRAASLAKDDSLYAFARLEQAHLVAELADASTAESLAESVYRNVAQHVPEPLRCWMAASVAEMHALAGNDSAARQMLSNAEGLMGSLGQPTAPYLVFDPTHLRRWLGHTLVILADPAAQAQLEEARDSMDATFARAGASLHLDLATVLIGRGDKDEGLSELAEGELLARRVGSRRQMLRAGSLRAGVLGE